jgi:hypothetical protein
VPIFMVERRFAGELETSAEDADQINRINEEKGVRWLYSFMSADKRKTYCLYEAPFADAIRRAAERAGIPADAVVEVGGMVLPDGSAAGIPNEVPAGVTASEDEQPDLFWALRGGGGNFGVVTEFTFRLHPVPENIYGGLILFEREAAGDLFRYFDRFIDDAPREYGGYPAWHLAPPLPFIPADRVGEPFPALISC